MPEREAIARKTLETDCCVVGGGPAGIVAGTLLARAGVRVVVLEKHADFLRDFRGDTIHPSTLEIMHELGWLQDFLARPHDRASTLTGFVGGVPIPVADFSRLPTQCGFIAFMPQWDFLDFFTEKAGRYPAFRIEMEAEVDALIEEEGRVAGVHSRTPSGTLEVRSRLVLAADGRHSLLRDLSGLPVRELGAPMDVLWMRLPSRPGDSTQPLARFDAGRIVVMIYRGTYWQCGYVIPKGGFDEIRRGGIEAFRVAMGQAAPFVRDRLDELSGFEDIRLLTVAVNRLERWHRPGLLCIGDAAHAMSPIGGVGINLAIQDAVAAANALAAALIRGRPTASQLRAVQKRRELPTRVTQRVQLVMQDWVIGRVLAAREPLTVPLPLRMLRRWPVLRRIPARLIGIGLRPEHVRSREASVTGPGMGA